MLRHAVIFVLLTSHSDAQSELLTTLSGEKCLKEMPETHTTREIIAYPLQQDQMLREHATFKDAPR